MTIRLSMPFVFDCDPGEEKRIEIVANAPLPAPMAQCMNLDSLVALFCPPNLDNWEITELRVLPLDGPRMGDIITRDVGPIPAAFFSRLSIGGLPSTPFSPGDTLTCAARNKGFVRAKLVLTGVVRPHDWLFFCLGCGASVWTTNFYEPRFCDVCRGTLYHYEPRDGDAGFIS
jgi:hypothetical protein